MKPVVVEFYRKWDNCFCGHRIKNVVVMEFIDHIPNSFDIPQVIKVGVDCASIIMDHDLFGLLTRKVYLELLDEMDSYDMRTGDLNTFRALLTTKHKVHGFMEFIDTSQLIDTLQICYPEVHKKTNDFISLSLREQKLLITEMDMIRQYFKKRMNVVYGKLKLDELEHKLIHLPEESMLVTSTSWVLNQSNDKTHKNAIGEDIPTSILRDWWQLIYYGYKLSFRQRDVLIKYL